jgi:hypothetical protein
VFDQVRKWVAHSGSGRHVGRPDLDSLNVAQGALDGLANHEKRLMVGFWAMVGAPMYTGNDLTRLNASGTAMLTHTLLAAVQRDVSGMSALPVSTTGDPIQVSALALCGTPRSTVRLLTDFCSFVCDL